MKKILYFGGLCFFFSIICLSPYSLAQEYEFTEIFINNHLVENVEGSEWVKEKSDIMIKGTNGDPIIKLKIDPDPGLLDVIYSAFQLEVMVDKSLCETKDIHQVIKDKIKKYKVKLEKKEREFVSLDVIYRNKFELGVMDWLIVPFVFKLLIIEPYQCLVRKNSNIKIYVK